MKIPNILDQFNSYSYHHILMLSGSTRVVDQLSQTDFPYSDLLKKDTTSGEGFRVQRKRIVFDATTGSPRIEDAPDYSHEDESFVIVSSGTQDAEILVEQLRWDSLFAPNFTSGEGIESYATFALDGKMVIREPRGARFLQFLDQAYDALGIDPASAFLIIKTIFVGHSADFYDSSLNTTATVPITNVPPLAGYIYSIAGEFDSTGATYVVDFVGMNNGISKLEQFNFPLGSTISGIPATVGSGEETQGVTLATAIQTLQETVQRRYDEYVQMQRAKDSNFDNEYRTIEYEIRLDDEYLSDEYRIDQIRTWAEEEGEGSGGSIAFYPDSSLEQAIHTVMRACSRVAKDSEPQGVDENTNLGNAYIYKISSTVESGNNIKTGATNTSPFRVIYNIHKYKINTVIASNKQHIVEWTDYNPDDNSIWEYDYIFTGKNLDVIDFNMSMDTAFMFLVGYTNKSTITSPMDEVTGVAIGNNAETNSIDYDLKGRRSQKLFMPPGAFKNPLSSFNRDNIADASFRTSLNAYASLGAFDSKLTIRGNPFYLHTQIPKRASTDIAGENNVSPYPDWKKNALLVKVNVKMPSGDPNTPNDYEPFWYQGAYTVLSVENIFDSNGGFTHKMELIPTFAKTDFGFGSIDEVKPETAEGGTTQQLVPERTSEMPDYLTAYRDGFLTAQQVLDEDGNLDFFATIIERTFGFEGGYVNNPSDPGGPTNYGISMNNLLARKWRDSEGRLIGDINGDGQITIDDIQNMTRDYAKTIYRAFYWNPYPFDQLPYLELAFQVFDHGVTSGPNTSIRQLQEALNAVGKKVSVDGVLGSQTLEAVIDTPESVIVPAMMQQRIDFYTWLAENKPGMGQFLNGWLRRVTGGDYGKGRKW